VMIFVCYRISDSATVNAISSVAVNSSAEWIALASSEMGQLCVWEWQSQTHVLKQQSHFGSMDALAYSPDAQFIVTGGLDGKVCDSSCGAVVVVVVVGAAVVVVVGVVVVFVDSSSDCGSSSGGEHGGDGLVVVIVVSRSSSSSIMLLYFRCISGTPELWMWGAIASSC